MKASLPLKISIAFKHADSFFWIAMTLGIAAFLCHFLLLPRLEQRYKDASEYIDMLKAEPEILENRGTNTQQAITAFESVLKKREEIPLILEKQFEIARQYRIELGRGEYRLDRDPEGGFSYYRITLPVTGPYSALRPYMETLLAEWPGMALEQVSFSRGHAGENETEAVLRFAILVGE